MKLPAQALLIACTALVAAAAAAPVVTPAVAVAPAPAVAATAPALPAPAAPAPPAAAAPAPPAPAGDYTSRSLDPELVPEYDPASAPPPTPLADPTDEGGLRQCVGPDGVPIFTDRRCADLGATAQVQPPGSFDAAAASPVRVRTCARTQAVLLDGVRAALESHDANRLADYYHWSGMDTAEGYRLMDRLDAFSARPVVDVQLVRDAPPPSQDASYGSLYFDTPPRLPPSEPLFGPDGQALPGAAPGAPGAPAVPQRARRLASMLRVDQMRSDQDVAATVTYFHLLTNAGCWWMRF
jgi:hypothetical protein